MVWVSVARVHTHYDDTKVPLVLDDFSAIEAGKDPTAVLADVVNTSETGQYQALVMQFDLPSSSYATMVVREITKMATDVVTQVRARPCWHLVTNAAPVACLDLTMACRRH